MRREGAPKVIGHSEARMSENGEYGEYLLQKVLCVLKTGFNHKTIHTYCTHVKGMNINLKG